MASERPNFLAAYKPECWEYMVAALDPTALVPQWVMDMHVTMKQLSPERDGRVCEVALWIMLMNAQTPVSMSAAACTRVLYSLSRGLCHIKETGDWPHLCQREVDGMTALGERLAGALKTLRQTGRHTALFKSALTGKVLVAHAKSVSAIVEEIIPLTVLSRNCECRDEGAVQFAPPLLFTPLRLVQLPPNAVLPWKIHDPHVRVAYALHASLASSAALGVDSKEVRRRIGDVAANFLPERTCEAALLVVAKFVLHIETWWASITPYFAALPDRQLTPPEQLRTAITQLTGQLRILSAAVQEAHTVDRHLWLPPTFPVSMWMYAPRWRYHNQLEDYREETSVTYRENRLRGRQWDALPHIAEVEPAQWAERMPAWLDHIMGYRDLVRVVPPVVAVTAHNSPAIGQPWHVVVEFYSERGHTIVPVMLALPVALRVAPAHVEAFFSGLGMRTPKRLRQGDEL